MLAQTETYDETSHTLTFEGCFMSSYTRSLDMKPRLVKHVTIDLTKVDRIDSSALGLLLLSRDYRLASPIEYETIVLRCLSNSNVSRVLDIANFKLLFTIELVPS